MVPFWIPIIIRHLIFRVPKKGTIILTTTQMDLIYPYYPSSALYVKSYPPAAFLDVGFLRKSTKRSGVWGLEFGLLGFGLQCLGLEVFGVCG